MTLKTNGRRFTEPELHDQRNQGLRLWMQGRTFQQIADELDVSIGTAYSRVQDAIDASRPHADFDRYRATQLTELELSRIALRRIIVSRHVDVPELVAAIGGLLKIQEREAKLVGLDRVDVPIDDLTSMSDEELAAVAAEWAEEYRSESQ